MTDGTQINCPLGPKIDWHFDSQHLETKLSVAGGRRWCGRGDSADVQQPEVSTSFQSWTDGRNRFTAGCKAIIRVAAASPGRSASKPQ